MSTVLVINAGSSSLKYQLLDPHSGTVAAKGLVERIGEPTGHVSHTVAGVEHDRDLTVADHAEALRTALALCKEHGPDLGTAGMLAVGHRLVMGGALVTGPTLVTDTLLSQLDELTPLAPLHNPANLTGINGARQVFGDLPQVVVADTAFFHDLPTAARTYALDRELAERHGIRRYGFHGTSHDYVSTLVRERVGRDDLRQVVLHLGNGCSASAVVGTRPVETSMGLTPLEGLVMGTRTGDLDPAILFHLARVAGMSIDELDSLCNKRSGLLGLTGSNDMRTVLAAMAEGDRAADLAVEVYVHRIRKYIGAYAATMGGIDVLTFTAGVGENSPFVREKVCAGLEFLGIHLDPDRNAGITGEGPITTDGSPAEAWVVPTNEELMIARQTLQVVDA